jgi:hypothetical protein
MGEEHFEGRPLPSGSWRCVGAARIVPSAGTKYKSPDGYADLIRLGQ